MRGYEVVVVMCSARACSHLYRYLPHWRTVVNWAPHFSPDTGLSPQPSHWLTLSPAGLWLVPSPLTADRWCPGLSDKCSSLLTTDSWTARVYNYIVPPSLPPSPGQHSVAPPLCSMIIIFRSNNTNTKYTYLKALVPYGLFKHSPFYNVL